MRLWVVEMKIGGVWEPTTGTALNRREGRRELAKWSEWREFRPCDEYRLRAYVRAK